MGRLICAVPCLNPFQLFWRHHTIKDLLVIWRGLKFLPCGIFMPRRSSLRPLHSETTDESEVLGGSPTAFWPTLNPLVVGPLQEGDGEASQTQYRPRKAELCNYNHIFTFSPWTHLSHFFRSLPLVTKHNLCFR